MSAHPGDAAFDIVVETLKDWVPSTFRGRVAARLISALKDAGFVMVHLERTECRGSGTGQHHFADPECTRCGATA